MLGGCPKEGSSQRARGGLSAEECHSKSWELTGGFLSWFVCLETIVISTHRRLWETGGKPNASF